MLRNLRSRILSDTNRNALVLLYGTVLSQALPLVFSPILARLYTPAEFGAFSLFFGIVAILGNISSGKLDFALYTAQSKQNAVITALTGIVFCLTFSTIVLLASLLVILFLPTEKLSPLAVGCIPLSVLFIGCSNVLVALSNRQKEFKKISQAKVLLGAIWVVVNMLLGLASANALGLILGYTLGQMTSALYLLNVHKLELFGGPYNLKTFKFNLLRNKNYALIFLPAHLLNTASASAPSLFLSYLFNLNANGLFFKAARIGEAPTTIIRNSLGNVFWQQASHDFLTKGSARHTMKEFLKKLLILGLPGYLILYLFAGEIFTILFGPEWSEAADYFKILAPYFLTQFLLTPLTIMIVLANKPLIDITWQVFYSLCIILSFSLGAFFEDIILGLRLYTISMITMQIISFALNYHYSLKR